MAALLAEFHQRSIYAERGEFQAKEVKALLAHSLQKHGHRNRGGRFVAVAGEPSVVVGFIVGMLEPVYHALDTLMATDLWFICGDDADPHDALKLLQSFVAWAETVPKVIEIRAGVTNAMGDDWQRLDALYRRCGFQPAGAMYERRVR